MSVAQDASTAPLLLSSPLDVAVDTCAAEILSKLTLSTFCAFDCYHRPSTYYTFVFTAEGISETYICLAFRTLLCDA